MSTFGAADVALAVLSLVVVAGVAGWTLWRGSTRTSSEFFLAGHSMGFGVVAASLVSSNIGAEHFVGLAGAAAEDGLPVGMFEWYASLLLLLLGWVLAPLYARAAVVTTTGFLEQRFSRVVRVIVAFLTVLVYCATKISASLYAADVIFAQTLGWSPGVTTAVMVVTTGAYTAAGGLRVVMATDFAQAITLTVGASIILGVALDQIGGWDALKDAAPEEHMHLFRGPEHPRYPATGMLLGQPLVSLWYWGIDPSISQRVLAARSLADARLGCAIAAAFKVLPVFLFVVPGMIAQVLYPDDVANDADTAYASILVRSDGIPPGVLGVLVASIAGALMSSLSSVFNSGAAIASVDVLKTMRPSTSDRGLVLAGRIATLGMLALSLIWIPVIQSASSGLFLFINAVTSAVVPPISAVFVFGFVWKRANEWGALAALAVGTCFGSVRLALEVARSPSPFATMNFMHFALIAWLVSAVVLVAASLATSAPPESKLALFHGARFVELRELDDEAPEAAPERERLSRIANGLTVVVVLTQGFLWVYFGV